MKLSGWLLVVALLFAAGTSGIAFGILLGRAAFQAGFRLGTAQWELLGIPTGGLCQRAEPSVKR